MKTGGFLFLYFMKKFLDRNLDFSYLFVSEITHQGATSKPREETIPPHAPYAKNY